jgi:ribosomal protein L11 methylase PrmA
MHLHIHAQMQAKAANSGTKAEVSSKFNKNAILGLVDNLESLVQGLKWTPDGTEWANYYEDTNYSSESMDSKHKLVVEFLESIAPRPQMVWDLGANNGEFSSLASKRGMMTVAWDIDPAAVEKNYITRKSDPKMLPLVQDLTNPSPSIGWSNAERDSLAQRGPVDAVMALALIHHLAIGNNVPLEMIADFLAKVSQNLIIEFVPKEDSQVQRLLASREDIFSRYDIENFRKAFGRMFDLTIEREIPGSKRTLFMMRKKAA